MLAGWMREAPLAFKGLLVPRVTIIIRGALFASCQALCPAQGRGRPEEESLGGGSLRKDGAPMPLAGSESP